MTDEEHIQAKLDSLVLKHNAALSRMTAEQKKVVERSGGAMMISLTASMAHSEKYPAEGPLEPLMEPMVAMGLILYGEAMGVTPTEICNRAVADIDGFLEMVKALDFKDLARSN